MPTPLVVTHERLGTWAAHLRPRLAASSPGPATTLRLVESRSTEDLAAVILGAAAPIVVIDLADRPRAMLDDLDLAVQSAPGGFFLVLVPGDRLDLATLARELGATLTVPSATPPPRVAEQVARWLPLARARAEADGWAVPDEPRPEPWERAAREA